MVDIRVFNGLASRRSSLFGQISINVTMPKPHLSPPLTCAAIRPKLMRQPREGTMDGPMNGIVVRYVYDGDEAEWKRLPKVKQTQSALKRTWGLNVGCWG